MTLTSTLLISDLANRVAALQEENDTLRTRLAEVEKDAWKEGYKHGAWSNTTLSDKEIRKLQSQYPTDNDPMQFARAIERHVRGEK